MGPAEVVRAFLVQDLRILSAFDRVDQADVPRTRGSSPPGAARQATNGAGQHRVISGHTGVAGPRRWYRSTRTSRSADAPPPRPQPIARGPGVRPDRDRDRDGPVRPGRDLAPGEGARRSLRRQPPGGSRGPSTPCAQQARSGHARRKDAGSRLRGTGGPRSPGRHVRAGPRGRGYDALLGFPPRDAIGVRGRRGPSVRPNAQRRGSATTSSGSLTR